MLQEGTFIKNTSSLQTKNANEKRSLYDTPLYRSPSKTTQTTTETSPRDAPPTGRDRVSCSGRREATKATMLRCNDATKDQWPHEDETGPRLFIDGPEELLKRPQTYAATRETYSGIGSRFRADLASTSTSTRRCCTSASGVQIHATRITH